MNLLFWGLFFCLLDFEIAVGSAVIGLLPDAAGYFLLMKGMTSLAEEDEAFDRGRHWAFALMLVSVILYGADLLNPAAITKVGFWILGFCELLVMLVLLRRMISGITGMESDCGWHLDSERLKAVWMILAVMQPLCYLLSWIPLVGHICIAASAVTGVLFLLTFWRSRKRYYRYRA